MVVFDSSTLIILAKVELLDVFLDSFKGKVAVTPAVKRECLSKKTFDALLIEKRMKEEKILVTDVRGSALCSKLARDFNLGAGEAEVVALAFSEKALVATDDSNAINACKLLKLEFTTAIHFLLRAFEKHLLGGEKALEKLGEIAAHGRYSKKIIDDAKKRIEG